MMQFLRDPVMQGAGFLLGVLVLFLQYPQFIIWLVPLSIFFVVLLFIGHRYYPESNNTQNRPRNNMRVGVNSVGQNLIKGLRNWIIPLLLISILLTSGFFTVKGIVAQLTPGSTDNPEFQKTIDDFLYTFKGCYRKDENVECLLQIRNQGEDLRDLSLNGGYPPQTVIYDGASRYVAQEVELADQLGSVHVRLSMPSNNNIEARASFANVPENINKLRVDFAVGTRTIQIVSFEDVPLSN